MNNQNTIDMFVAQKTDYFPAESMNEIKSKLAAMDNERLTMVTAIDYKQPMIMLLISIFLGALGVDRFMLGHTMYGVIKLLTGGGCGIWWLIDLFLISKLTREANYQKFIALAGK